MPSAEERLDGVDSSTLDCAGDRVFASSVFEGATVDPQAIEEGRLTYGGGVNRLRVIWLRSHTADGQQAAGPLALVRVLDDYAEVYGVGAYKGEPEKSRFGLERLGGELVVTAVSDGCSGADPAASCDSTLRVFRPVGGRLDLMAEIGLERVRHASGVEPGVTGDLRFKLTSSPQYEKDGIHVIEEVVVTDSAGKKVRRAELERRFLLDRAAMNATAESLWTLVYEERVGSKQAKAGATSKEPTPKPVSGEAVPKPAVGEQAKPTPTP
ncbi:MAG TPA: hypothetical protein VLC09_20680 [Polyangiaceae bacterium]|nr:hypothetical protein [Polyangiaceae bacterium]